MSTITGYITLVCFLLLVVKYPLRKLGFYKANAFLMKLHEGASAGVFLIGIVHIVAAAKKFGLHGLGLGISGILAYGLCIAIITACHLTKDLKKKMRDHRVLSLMAALATALHIAFYWI